MTKTFEPVDVDIFMDVSPPWQMHAYLLRKFPLTRCLQSENCLELDIPDVGKVDIVVKPYPYIHDFDISVCQIATDGEIFVAHPLVLHQIHHRSGTYNQNHNNGDPERQAARLAKYRTRGFALVPEDGAPVDWAIHSQWDAPLPDALRMVEPTEEKYTRYDSTFHSAWDKPPSEPSSVSSSTSE